MKKNKFVLSRRLNLKSEKLSLLKAELEKLKNIPCNDFTEKDKKELLSMIKSTIQKIDVLEVEITTIREELKNRAEQEPEGLDRAGGESDVEEMDVDVPTPAPSMAPTMLPVEPTMAPVGPPTLAPTVETEFMGDSFEWL